MRHLAGTISARFKGLDERRLILGSGMFDAEWYARTYPDAGNSREALTHFITRGASRRNDPSPDFSTSAYLAANPDVQASGINALVHYLKFGRKEGRGIRGGEDGGLAPLGTVAMQRIADAFDAEFYRATNPDLSVEEATVEHYLGVGWRERRDPCAWFSTEFYLTSHGDVAAEAQNPFAHYLLWGCREGRGIRASIRRRQEEHQGETSDRPIIAALAMVRNESDIIHTFASHLLALFDDIVFIDHMSDDGTGDFLNDLASESQRVTTLKLEEPAYIQSVATTHAVREVDALTDADWVFMLDADEFLPFDTREAFEAALTRYRRCPVISMRWQNLIPEEYWTDRVTIDGATRFIMPPDLSPFRKVAFQPSRVAMHRTIVAQGNHALVERQNGFEVPSYDADFPLLHVPVRSVDQMLLKLNQGVDAYNRLGRTRDAAHGTHWDQMLKATAEAKLNGDFLNAMAVDYSEPKAELKPVSANRLLTMGHRIASFDLAQNKVGVEAPKRRGLGEMLMRIHGRAEPELSVEDCTSTTRLYVEGSVLRRHNDDPGADYGSLARVSVTSSKKSPSDILARFLAPGYRDIVDLVPSPKTGHIPFLFSLVDLLRPRRIVEVGTLRGASFLALCQAVRQAQLDCDAIAISSWAVGPELEAQYPNVFENFLFLVRKYAEFASHLRMDYEIAAQKFAAHSVDLIHLDGFCEEAPLRRALDVWLPKLSDRGVVLLHDTNAFGGDFGVWRVWEDLASEHPSLGFGHGQGLGVACIGSDVPRDLAAFCRLLSEDRHARALVAHHFERQGQLSTELFSRRFDMAQSEARALSEGTQAEELSWLRQEVESLRNDNAQLRDLLKKEIHLADIA